MDALTILAASGMRSRLETLELLANNIANQSTAGYKPDREAYNLYLSAEALDPWAPPATILPVVERQWIDFQQGTFTPTGNPLDLAISGPGFFVLEGPQGLLYTRNGHFRLTPEGYLVSEPGWRVLDIEKRPIRLDPTSPVEVNARGELLQNGAIVARLAVMEFADPQRLVKTAGACFRAPQGVNPVVSERSQVHQGQLEGPNFSVAEAAVRLVDVLRQFEALTRAVQLGHEMNRKLVEEVAHPGR